MSRLFGVRSPTPFSRPPARRRRAPAAAGSSPRPSDRVLMRSLSLVALSWLSCPFDPLRFVRSGDGHATRGYPVNRGGLSPEPGPLALRAQQYRIGAGRLGLGLVVERPADLG